MQNFSNFLPQYFVLAVLVTDFVFQQVRDLEWVDAWFASGAFDTCGQVCRFFKCVDCLDREW